MGHVTDIECFEGHDPNNIDAFDENYSHATQHLLLSTFVTLLHIAYEMEIDK